MRPLILITNDDGIYSPGLKAAAEAVADLGDLLMVAPRFQQTAMGRSYPVIPTQGVIEEIILEIAGHPHLAYGVHGSPSQAVLHGVMELAPHQPDLCISGINYGDNIGVTMAASGTIGAAFEASTCGIPALAVSREVDMALHRSENYAELDWRIPAYFTRLIAEKMLRNGLPAGVDVLNLNIPEETSEMTEIRLTVQSQWPHFYYTRSHEKRDFSQRFLLPLTKIASLDSLEPNSDIKAVVFDRVISLTPLRSNFTAPVDLGNWSSDGHPQKND